VRAAGPDYPLARSPSEYREPAHSSAVFGSYHPGICQFAFCDGSVRPLPVGIDAHVLGLLASRNDGEVIPEY
jgi:prepilin-type processing-associated H-X9-DG protein